MLRRSVLCAAVLMVFLGTPGADGAVTTGEVIAVRLHNSANLDAARLEAALRVAASALAAASLDVQFERCGPGRCATPLRDRELAVRFVRPRTRDDVGGTLPLGDVLLDRGAGAGVLATIYVNRVEWLANVSGGDAATLLGHAVAHELGHLLLASSQHSAGGLMRATWSLEEIRERREADWTFTAPDIAALRARLRGVPVSPEGRPGSVPHNRTPRHAERSGMPRSTHQLLLGR